MRAGFYDPAPLYRAAMLRRLLALFALITGLAATATPAEAAWAGERRASVVASAFAVTGQAEQHLHAEFAALNRPVAAPAEQRSLLVERPAVRLAPVILKADRALE